MGIKEVLLYIHQLPQNLVGFMLTRKPKHTVDFICNDGSTVKVYFTKNVFDCGVSLGNYIVLDDDVYYQNVARHIVSSVRTVNHEHGHQIQSKYLGWLYFIIIGLPSAMGNLIDRFFHKKWSSTERIKWYYGKLPWEKWADELGEVKRF
ncbi:MAG: hypothetical protein J6Y78_09225 [Paludibacteraceae bacterium]|nr:hypothetical protein [Paludibacteraceae bacterium]